jgi:hypothetical protein
MIVVNAKRFATAAGHHAPVELVWEDLGIRAFSVAVSREWGCRLN